MRGCRAAAATRSAASTTSSRTSSASFDNVITFADNFGKQRDSYDGVDLSMNARFPNGATLAGGTNTERREQCLLRAGRSVADAGDADERVAAGGRSLDDCDISLPWQTQFKFHGSYPLPWDG